MAVARGRKFERIGLADGPPADLADRMLGRSGKLRAPTMRVGDALLVGFHAEMLAAFL